MTIEVEGLRKRFGAVTAADDVSIHVEEGSLTALLGPSGSGKTTVLRMIAGLEIPDAGRITVNGADITHLAPQKRNIGFVFQQYALFRHMRVADNIAFPLKVRRWKKDAIRERVAELLRLLRIDGLEKRYPDQISGGQRQRVAFARALAAHPQVLLLDEPFSALDARVRDELREWLRGLHDELHVTSLFVTHDQAEAMELADRVVIMHNGKVEQEGAPGEIVSQPGTPFVMNFLGRANELRGEALHGRAILGGVEVAFPSANGKVVPVVGYFRPGDALILRDSAAGAIGAEVGRVVLSGSQYRVQLVTEHGLPLQVEVDARTAASLALEAGERVFVRPERVYVFEAAAIH